PGWSSPSAADSRGVRPSGAYDSATASGTRRPSWHVSSARSHPQGAVHPDDLTVEVVVVDERERQLGVFFGATEALRERDPRSQAGAELFGDGGQHRGLDDAGRDREHADAVLRQVASSRQVETDDAALR